MLVRYGLAAAPRPAGRGAAHHLARHSERLGQLRLRAVAGVDVDAARLDYEPAAVAVEPEVALVEPERQRPALTRIERHALEPAEPADRLGDASHRVVDVQ